MTDIQHKTNAAASIPVCGVTIQQINYWHLNNQKVGDSKMFTFCIIFEYPLPMILCMFVML